MRLHSHPLERWTGSAVQFLIRLFDFSDELLLLLEDFGL